MGRGFAHKRGTACCRLRNARFTSRRVRSGTGTFGARAGFTLVTSFAEPVADDPPLRSSTSFLFAGALGLTAADFASRRRRWPRPAAFTALGVGAPYLSGDVIGGTRARAAKMRAAKITPLAPQAVPAYLGELEGELRRQTAGIGLDVLRIGNSIVIRIPGDTDLRSGERDR